MFISVNELYDSVVDINELRNEQLIHRIADLKTVNRSIFSDPSGYVVFMK